MAWCLKHQLGRAAFDRQGAAGNSAFHGRFRMAKQIAVLAVLLISLMSSVLFAGVTAQSAAVAPGVMQELLLKKVNPVYPADAKKDHIQGEVRLKVTIGKEGSVENIRVVSGPEQLAPAAIEGVRQWKYKPYRVNGSPVEVQTDVVVNFTLAE